VAWSGDDAAYQDFVSRYGLGFDNVQDDDGIVFARFTVLSQPAWAFVSSDGTLDVVSGVLDEADLLARLDSMT
jgi:hypothetical protein